MSDSFIDRMIVEEKELNDKTVKLSDFMKSDKFDELSLEIKIPMVKQLVGMEAYLEALRERMAYFKQN